jgi:hypothetical protein
MFFALMLLLGLAAPLAFAQGDNGTDAIRLDDATTGDLTYLYQEGLEQWGIEMGWGRQHNLPTGPRSGMAGDTLAVSYGRFRSQRDIAGVCASYGRIRALQHHVSEVSAQGTYTHIFSLEPRRAAYWDVGLGLMHFNDLVREQATHTNFVEHIGWGLTWPDGDNGTGAWSLQYRFMHVSNAGRKHPNIGLNSSHFSVVYTWYR